MLYQTSKAAAILGMEPWQVQSYAKQGLVDPAVTGRGAGSRRAYDLLGLIKLALLNRLNRDGFDVRTIRPIFASLFDFPFSLGGDDPESERAKLKEWFGDKVLLTCEHFGARKLIRRERLREAAPELLCDHEGLYVIDLGRIVIGLLKALGENERQSEAQK